MDDITKDTIPRKAVEYCLRKKTVSTNPEAYKAHKKFIGYMDDPEISQFGHWMHANGYNCALVSVAVDLDKIPSAQPEPCATGYVGAEDDYPVSVKQVLNITAETGALATQMRVRELPRYAQPVDKDINVTDNDTISRQGVLRLLNAVPSEEFATKAMLISGVKALPSAQPGGWIPTSERLPDVRQWVLCQCRVGIMDILRLTADGSWNKNYPHTEYMSGFVVAWMPLPKPWEGKHNA